MAVTMNGVDVITFTAGVGEKGPISRAGICSHLTFMGVLLDPDNKTLCKRYRKRNLEWKFKSKSLGSSNKRRANDSKRNNGTCKININFAQKGASLLGEKKGQKMKVLV